MAKFDLERARGACAWIEEVVGYSLNPPSDEINDQRDMKNALKDGQALCM
jgi:hypothetical protein